MADSFLLSPADGGRAVFAEGVKARSINGFLQYVRLQKKAGADGQDLLLCRGACRIRGRGPAALIPEKAFAAGSKDGETTAGT